MISYFRTTKMGVAMAIKALDAIPVMVLKSIRSNYIFHAYSEAERIIYDLDREEWFTQTKIIDTDRILIIPSCYLQDAQIKEMVHGIVMPWIHITQQGLSKKNWYYTDTYAYETNNGDIFFKITGIKKQLKFKKSLLLNTLK